MMDFATIAHTKRKADIAARALADAETPLIRNAWYVAAKTDAVTAEPISRTILNSPVMLFRKQDGTPVALQDRCCHRSFPLSESKVENDIITCRYHGLQYDCAGTCIAVPGRAEPPTGLAVRAYPLLEKSPYIWIWTGDPVRADPALCPHPDWLGHPDWAMHDGYLNPPGSYIHMHENLLDLSHLSFLHEKTFGTPEYAAAPIETRIEGDVIEVWRHVECSLPALYAKPLGWEGQRAMRHSGSRYVAPGLHVNTGIFENLDTPLPEGSTPPQVKVAQLLTPETQGRVHYHYAMCRNFCVGDAEMTAFMAKANFAAFSEDLWAIDLVYQRQQQEDPDFFYELNIATDRPGLEMRRLLKRLSDAEQTAAMSQGRAAAEQAAE